MIDEGSVVVSVVDAVVSSLTTSLGACMVAMGMDVVVVEWTG